MTLLVQQYTILDAVASLLVDSVKIQRSGKSLSANLAGSTGF